MSHKNMFPENSVYTSMKSPVGTLWLVASDKGLHWLSWDLSKSQIAGLKKSETHSVISKAKKQLTEYFNGERKSFDLPLVMEGTPFQKKAWTALTRIPYGKTISYQQQAVKVGDAKKCRAVGMANSKNPVAIVVPCHRVIGKNGKLTGFGGGLGTKDYLLTLEANNI